jgi:hypothetical protein
MIRPALDWHTHYFLIPLVGALPGVLSALARSSVRAPAGRRPDAAAARP